MCKLNFELLFVLTSFLLFPSHCDAKEVCYGRYGCFNKDKPFANPVILLPQSPSDVRTTYNLYTRSNRNNAQVIVDNDGGILQSSTFDVSKRTMLLVHGWKESGSSDWLLQMKDALLVREDYNVIVVDWSGGSKTEYKQAAGNARLVGAQIGELIRFLILSNSGPSIWADRFYIVGFSLGAQIGGYAGSYMKARRMTLGRITGLDPAGPFFGGKDDRLYLDKSDAEYVDIIHTNAGGAGSPFSTGHIDFYPNGGVLQPGCQVGSLECYHERATEYYIASVENKCSWKAYPCEGKVVFGSLFCKKCKGRCSSMGYDAERNERTGIYYLKTNSEAPFCGKS